MRPISAEASRGYSHLTSGTSKGPSHPCCNSRSSPTCPSPLERKQESPPTSREATFPPPSSRGLILSLRGGERIRGVPVASQEVALSRRKARGTPGSCHHCQSPPEVSVHSREPGLPALPRLSSRGSTHTTVARGTALWESLMGKPRGKASWESLVGKPQIP